MNSVAAQTIKPSAALNGIISDALPNNATIVVSNVTRDTSASVRFIYLNVSTTGSLYRFALTALIIAIITFTKVYAADAIAIILLPSGGLVTRRNTITHSNAHSSHNNANPPPILTRSFATY